MSAAALLPPPRAVFYDPATGDPLVGGFVYTYVPGGTVPAETWQDENQATENSNPIVLDSEGSCLLYGSGAYQLTVTDALGNAVPGYSGLSYSPPIISVAMQPVVAATTVEKAFDLLAVNGGTVGVALDILGDLTVSDTLSANIIDVQDVNVSVSLVAEAATFTTPLAVASGGTGLDAVPHNAILIGEGTSAIGTLALGGSLSAVVSNGTVWGASPIVNSVTGSAQIAVSTATGNVTISAVAPAFLSVGSYVWAEFNGPASPGTNYAGSTLSDPTTGSSYGAAGTWTCMGLETQFVGCVSQAVGLWLRVA